MGADQRLLAQLDAGMASGVRLTLLVAPAGWGKTALLRRWMATSRWPVAWVTLSRADNDAAHFLADLRGAVAPLAAELPIVAPNGRVDDHLALEEGMIALINDLTRRSADWALVLDDYQHIRETAIHAAVTLLLDYPPPRLHIYLISRAAPPLPLARWRVRRQLVEIAIPGE